MTSQLCVFVASKFETGAATSQVAAGDVEGSLKSYSECNRLAPAFADAWVNRANIHLRAKRYAEAEPLLRKATEPKPNSTMAWNGLSVALKEQGKREDAIAAFRKALEHAPGHSGIASNLKSVEGK